MESTVIVEGGPTLDGVDGNVIPQTSRGKEKPVSPSWGGVDLHVSFIQFDGYREPVVVHP